MQRFAITCRRIWKKLPCPSLVAALIGAVIGIAAGRTLFGRVAVVNGSSMFPNYAGGTWVHYVSLSGGPQRGDVVILDDNNKEYAIKRVVGMPGETVQIQHGYVFINGRILLEPYIPKRTYTFPRQRQAIFVLGPEQYFVLGDNRPCSSDSRMYGPVEKNQLKGHIPLPAGAPRARFGPLEVTMK
jgi:signal peptidase I